MAYYKDPHVEKLYDIVNKHNVKKQSKIDELSSLFKETFDNEVKNINIPSRRTFTFGYTSHLLNIALNRTPWAVELILQYKKDILFETENDYIIFLYLSSSKLNLKDLTYIINNQENKYPLKDIITKKIDSYFSSNIVKDDISIKNIISQSIKNKDLEVLKFFINLNQSINENNINSHLNIEIQNFEHTKKIMEIFTKCGKPLNIYSFSHNNNNIDKKTYDLLFKTMKENNSYDNESIWYLSNLLLANKNIEFDHVAEAHSLLKNVSLDDKMKYKFNSLGESLFIKSNYQSETDYIIFESYIFNNTCKVNKESFKKLINFLIIDFESFILRNENEILKDKEKYTYFFSSPEKILNKETFLNFFNKKFEHSNKEIIDLLFKTHNLKWKDYYNSINPIYSLLVNDKNSYINNNNKFKDLLIHSFLKENKEENYTFTRFTEEEYKENSCNIKKYKDNDYILSYGFPSFIFLINSPEYKDFFKDLNFRENFILTVLYKLEHNIWNIDKNYSITVKEQVSKELLFNTMENFLSMYKNNQENIILYSINHIHYLDKKFNLKSNLLDLFLQKKLLGQVIGEGTPITKIKKRI